MQTLIAKLLPMAALAISLPLFADSALASPERCERLAGRPYDYSNCLNHEYTKEHLWFLREGGLELQRFNQRQYAADRTHAQGMRRMEIEATQLMQQRELEAMEAGRAHERGLQHQHLEFIQWDNAARRAHELAVLQRQQQDFRETLEWMAEEQRKSRNAALAGGFNQSFWGH